MRSPRTAYELGESQVSTPNEVVSLFWKIVKKTRSVPGRVLDLGAGDARFAIGGNYEQYEGVEIDPRRSKAAILPRGALIHSMCAFRLKSDGYDACIGNPPYVRHHDIEPAWRQRVSARIKDELGIDLSGIGNLYLYFLCLALMKTKADGLVALVIPFEWVSRPSGRPVRDYIRKQGWSVSIFRFEGPIFDGVLTTASVSIIDKTKQTSRWEYFNVLPNLEIQPRRGVSGSRFGILRHSKRGTIWARRGISPGGQKIFVLTETERREAGLRLSDVVPCVTSLRRLPPKVAELNKAAFRRYFVEPDERCWLIKSAGGKVSDRLRKYLSDIPPADRDTYACGRQDPWYRYEKSQVPKLLFHSGFVARGPKVVVNSIGAQAVGSVYGVHSGKDRFPLRQLRSYLAKFNFERRVVAHARTLRKVEVGQLNSVLTRWSIKSAG